VPIIGQGTGGCLSVLGTNLDTGTPSFRFGLPASACQAIECQPGDSMTDNERNTCGSKRPKYPPPPRSGNAFAAAVFAAIPCLLLLIALLWLFA